MNEWGLPDWRNVESYGDCATWPEERWRWEFSRRRKDLRAAFDAHAEDCYQLNLQINEEVGDETRLPKPSEPGFIAICTESEAFGYMGIPNPRISEQPLSALFLITDPRGSIVYFPGEHDERSGPLDGGSKVPIIFDIDKPLVDQIATASRALNAEQKARHGELLQRRQHPRKWINYLRVLDAREAGASWADITSILVTSAGTPQAARDTWEQARALCFNF